MQTLNKDKFRGRACGVLIVGRVGAEEAIPATTVWKLVKESHSRTALLLTDAVSTGRTGDYGRIEERRAEISVNLSLIDAIRAFQRASAGEVVDISDAALSTESTTQENGIVPDKLNWPPIKIKMS